MEIKDVIKKYCNPATSDDLIKILEIFDDIEYDEFIEDIKCIIEPELNNDITRIPYLIHNVIMKFLKKLFEDLGITINDELDDILISELKEILLFILDIEYRSKEDAEYIYHALENEDDIILAFSEIVSKYLNMQSLRVYDIIENINISFITDIQNKTHSIITNNVDVIHNYNIMQVIREFKENDEHEILALRLSRNDLDKEDSTLDIYLKTNINKLVGKTDNETSINILSLLILAIDSRFDIVNSYTNIVENVIDDEYLKGRLFNIIKTLLPKVEMLYKKYNINEFNNE